MTSRTRYFVIISLLILIVGVGTGLVAYYVGLPGQALFGQGGPDELQLVPRNAALVAYADVRGIMSSDARQKLRLAVPVPENGRRELQERTGIDIESDIDHIVAALQPQQDGRTAGLVVARGRFSDVKIESFMREHGAAVEEYGGKRVIVPPASPTSQDMFAVSFLEPGVVALGDHRLVRAAIDLQKGGENITANSELMALVRSIESGDAWAVGRMDALRSDGRMPAQLAERLPAITWFSVSGRVDSNIRGVLRADARDEQAANDLRDVVRGFLALGKLQAGSQPGLQTLMQSLELGGTGKSVVLSFSIPAELLDALGQRSTPQTQ